MVLGKKVTIFDWEWGLNSAPGVWKGIGLIIQIRIMPYA